MTSRRDLESRPNWQATFERPMHGPYDCLMRTVKGGYYWHTPDYDGLMPAGATSVPFSMSLLLDCLELGHLKLVAGELPNC